MNWEAYHVQRYVTLHFILLFDFHCSYVLDTARMFVFVTGYANEVLTHITVLST